VDGWNHDCHHVAIQRSTSHVPAITYVVLVEVVLVEVVLVEVVLVEVVLVVVLVEVVFVVVFVLVGGMSQIVPLGSLTHCKVFKLQQVTPGQSWQ
jgi:hypothetical protein